MQVIIAEKPSVAREIAAIVGATNRKDGFIEGNGYAVTWAFGHLVGLAMPQQYGIAGFRRIYHFKQRREVLLVLWGFIPDIAD